MNNKVMKQKTFIFKYDPTSSPKRMFERFWESADTGKRHIQPKNVMIGYGNYGS